MIYASLLLIYVCLYIFTFHIGFDGERSILDGIFDEESLEDVLDVEMMDVEEKDLVGQDLQIGLGKPLVVLIL